MTLKRICEIWSRMLSHL
uniref:Uncharacterized protein n=1 Tax=Lepeophtheirus salmonis TaxID=72036 RepID=A0A0K2US04_LEPSM